MNPRFILRIWLLILCGELALPLYSAQTDTRSAALEKPALAENSATATNAFHVAPSAMDGRIAFITARMLEQNHYLRQPFDQSVSSKFLDRYLEALDPQHLHFLQADLADFEPYRTNLHHLTLTARDTRPGCEIFNRFMERLEQRVAYVDDLLKNEKFQFDADERITINRHELPYPKDLDEAKVLWRERLRFEYLQERLGKIGAKKKAETAPARTAQPQNSENHSAQNLNGAAPKLESRPKSDAEEIVETLSRRYHRTLRTFTDWNNEDVLQIYLTTLAHVYDPHSDYMGRAQMETFSIGMNLALFGIGAELFSDDGYCTIRRLLPGGPASKSKKIHEKDRIVAVAQGDQPFVDLVEMNLSKAVQLIRGPKGTEVRLTIISAGADASERTTIALIRDEIKLEDQEAKSKIIEVPNGGEEPLRLGVIDLPSFYATFDPTNSKDKPEPKSTTADVARLLAKLKKENVAGVILDLRHNGGGSLEEAIKLTGLFIKEGPVVQVRNSDGAVEEQDDTDPSVAYGGPLIVLTSRQSASASEILAGALQDYGRALIVGDSATHGKGTVQSVNPLRPFMHVPDAMLTNDPGALKLTIKKFYRASGASTQLKGVVPDIVLPSVLNESKDIGESALDNPLPWDTIRSAKFDHLDLVEPYLPELRKRSTTRIAADPEFAYIREDIEQFKKLQADKTVSLNEKQRLQEKEESEARDKARNQERLARKEPPEKVYELTLRQVNLPGLPPPVERTNGVAARLVQRQDGGFPVASNSVASSASASVRPNLDDSTDEEKAPPVDAALVETEHILVDYLSVLPKQKELVTAGH